MAIKKKNSKSGLISTNKVVGDNRRANFEYELHDRFEAGITLTGTEVKSLRRGNCSLAESYVGPKNGEIYIYNLHIPEYQQASKHLQHDPTRIRKLLLNKREINKLMGAVQKEGMTITATKLYFNDKGMVKLEIALAKGKKVHDKRETEKKRDWQRNKARIMRDHK
ncbi:MAG: SsrA-binding protein SmpB [Pseudomonadota bacterium]